MFIFSEFELLRNLFGIVDSFDDLFEVSKSLWIRVWIRIQCLCEISFFKCFFILESSGVPHYCLNYSLARGKMVSENNCDDAFSTEQLFGCLYFFSFSFIFFRFSCWYANRRCNTKVQSILISLVDEFSNTNWDSC